MVVDYVFSFMGGYEMKSSLGVKEMFVRTFHKCRHNSRPLHLLPPALPPSHPRFLFWNFSIFERVFTSNKMHVIDDKWMDGWILGFTPLLTLCRSYHGGQFTFSHLSRICSADLSFLPVLSAHTHARNWQLSNLNQRLEANDRRKDSMINHHMSSAPPGDRTRTASALDQRPNRLS